LEFTTTLVDKGEVRAGAALSHKFTFVNRGPNEVEITDIQSTCGCITPRLAVRRYSRGEHGSITVEINSLSPAPGPHSWVVKLFCREGNVVNEIPLQVKANLRREIIVEPAAVNMVVSAGVQSEIRLTDLRAQPLAIVAVDTSAPGLSAKITGEERDPAGHLVRRIQLQVLDSFPEGKHEESLRLYTNDPEYGEIKVPVTILKSPRQKLIASPGRVELIAGSGLPSSSRTILIRDRDNQPVEVEAVTSDHPGIACKWAKGPGAMTTVKLKLEGPVPEDSNWQTTIRVQAVRPVRQTVLIPVVISHESKNGK
jgi:hypothetical protein